MDGAGLIRRLSSGPARVCGLVAGGLGLVVALTAAVPPSGAQHGAAPHNRSTALGNFLTSVSAVSASDAWAVGNAPGLALHWNGTRWVRTAIPHSSSLSALNGVSALSASDAWAVGALGDVSTTTLALRWNGTAWARVASPSPGRSPLNDSLSGVSVLSASDAWAVGASGRGHTPFSPQKTLVLHWNGTRWTQVPAPSPRGTGTSPFTVLTGVSARSPSDAWAVGCACTNDFDTTLVLHWNGTAWARS